jgi:hypothetical protein
MQSPSEVWVLAAAAAAAAAVQASKLPGDDPKYERC